MAKKNNIFTTKDIVRLDMTKVIDEAWTVFKDSVGKGKRTLKLDTITTHSGKIINNRMYPGRHVKSSITSWYKSEDGAQYNKPVLKNHDPHSEPIGRIVNAEYKHLMHDAEWANDYLNASKAGSGFQQVTSHINDEDAIEKFLDGRYSTVSVSGDTNAAHCSTCTKTHGKLVDFRSEFEDSEGKEHQCDHKPGQSYNISDEQKEKSYIITGELFYDELSQVNMPADDGAVHVAKEILIKDSANGLVSILKDNDFGSSVDTLISVPRFAILDAQGNEINGLTTDSYKSTKTYSLPTKLNEIKDNSGSKSSSGNGMSEELFATALVLDHYSNVEQLELSDEEAETVKTLDTAELTETQKSIRDEKGFYVNQYLPFKLHDEHIMKAYWELGDRLTFLKDDEDKSTYMNAIEKQAGLEEISIKDRSNKRSNTGEKMLTKEQESALLKTVEDFEAKVKVLDEKLKTSEEKVQEMEGKLVSDKVGKLVDLRKKLGFYDAADAEGEDLTKLKDEYAKQDLAIIEFMLKDLEAQAEKKGAFDDEENLGDVEDPTKIKDEEAKKKAKKLKDEEDAQDSKESHRAFSM